MAADLGVTNPEHVFELSAMQAFWAATLLRELQLSPDIRLTKLETARKVAELLFGIRWQEQLRTLSKEQMRQEALYLWQHSGFPAFEGSALKTLVTEAPHRALRTALQTSQNCLRKIRQEIPLRNEKWLEGWHLFEAPIEITPALHH